MDAERKKLADAVTEAQERLVDTWFHRRGCVEFVDALVKFARAIREDERAELIAGMEANPT